MDFVRVYYCEVRPISELAERTGWGIIMCSVSLANASRISPAIRHTSMDYIIDQLDLALRVTRRVPPVFESRSASSRLPVNSFLHLSFSEMLRIV